jgi:hypothetical protein
MEYFELPRFHILILLCLVSSSAATALERSLFLKMTHCAVLII